MPITRIAAPPIAGDLIRRAVDDIEGSRADLLDAGHADAMTAPLPLYTIENRRAGRWPRRRHNVGGMTLAGWRSIVESADGYQLADVKEREQELRFARLVSGPRVDDMISAAKLAEDSFAESDYELRIFESSRLKVGAIWLAAQNSKFIPYAGLPQRVFDEAEFMEALTAREPSAPAAADFGKLMAAGGVVLVGLIAGVSARVQRSRRDRVTVTDDDDEQDGTMSVG